jgi:hypothetical protein
MTTTATICIPWRDSGVPERARAKDFIVNHYEKALPVVLGDSGHAEFNRAASRNTAAEQAGTDVLVFVDADAYIPLLQIDAAVEMAMKTGLLVKPFEAGGYLTKESSDELLHGDYYWHIDWMHPPVPGFVGLAWAIRRDKFELLRGFDPNFVGYGGEDNAFCAACDNLIGHTLHVGGFGYSLWHPMERDTPQANIDRVNAYYGITNWTQYLELRGIA